MLSLHFRGKALLAISPERISAMQYAANRSTDKSIDRDRSHAIRRIGLTDRNVRSRRCTDDESRACVFLQAYISLDTLFRASSRSFYTSILAPFKLLFLLYLSSPDSRKNSLLSSPTSVSFVSRSLLPFRRPYYLSIQAGTFTLMYEVNRKARCVHTSRDRGLEAAAIFSFTRQDKKRPRHAATTCTPI